jgi:predicted nucleotidyltransferase
MLSELFKTEKRVEILYYVLYHDISTVTEISRETGVSKGLVSRFLDYLKNNGLLERHGRKYCLNDTTKAREIKVLLNLDKIDLDQRNLDWADAIGIYGSWASGTNTIESDFDIWVKVEKYPPEQKISLLNKNLRAMTESEVNMLILTPEKLETLKNTDKPFYNSLLRNSIILKGESLE